jgi:hypothetical protein
VADLVTSESSVARAIKEMQNYDPTFDIQELSFEVAEVFKEFYCNFLDGNVEYLEKVASGPGLAVVKAEIKRREVEGWKNKYTELLDYGNVNFIGGRLMEKGVPMFTYTIVCSEVDCKINLKDGSIKEGNDNNLL